MFGHESSYTSGPRNGLIPRCALFSNDEVMSFCGPLESRKTGNCADGRRHADVRAGHAGLFETGLVSVAVALAPSVISVIHDTSSAP